MRDWLTSPESGWDRGSDKPPPALPAEIVEKTRERYVQAYEQLTGETVLTRPCRTADLIAGSGEGPQPHRGVVVGNLAALLENSAEKYADRTAIVFGDTPLHATRR